MQKFQDLCEWMADAESKGRALKITFGDQSLVVETLDELSFLPSVDSDLELAPVPYVLGAYEIGLYCWTSVDTVMKPILTVKITDIKVEEVDPDTVKKE